MHQTKTHYICIVFIIVDVKNDVIFFDQLLGFELDKIIVMLYL